MTQVLIRTFLLFYRQVFSFNFLISLFAGVVVPIPVGTYFKGAALSFLLVFLSVGFAGSLYFFEMRRKKQWYCYYNVGWSRWVLYGYAYLLTILISIPAFLI